VKDQLRKRYIQPLKSLQTLLVFFMLKEKENSVRLLIFEQLGDQEQLSIATNFRLDR